MTLDPQVRTMLRMRPPELMQSRDRTLDEQRLAIADLAPLQAGAGAQEVSAEDRGIWGPDGVVVVRVYTPRAGRAPRPVVLFLHGGGFTAGDLETHDALCRDLAAGSGTLVVAVDYRRAPEHRFPAALDDAMVVLRWVATDAERIGGTPERIAVAGDSAGGNLAAALTLRARDARLALRSQVLLYPFVDLTLDQSSQRSLTEYGGGEYFLSEDALRMACAAYLRPDDQMTAPLVSPLCAADLAGLPPALIITAEYDPLRDQGEMYGRRLADAGVPVTVRRWPGMVHDFMVMQAVVDEANEAIAEAAAVLRAALA